MSTGKLPEFGISHIQWLAHVAFVCDENWLQLEFAAREFGRRIQAACPGVTVEQCIRAIENQYTEASE